MSSYSTDLVHEVCGRIRFLGESNECCKCPASVNIPNHGDGVAGCYLAAEETIKLILSRLAGPLGRDSIIEECAKAAEAYDWGGDERVQDPDTHQKALATAVRALKYKPTTSSEEFVCRAAGADNSAQCRRWCGMRYCLSSSNATSRPNSEEKS